MVCVLNRSQSSELLREWASDSVLFKAPSLGKEWRVSRVANKSRQTENSNETLFTYKSMCLTVVSTVVSWIFLKCIQCVILSLWFLSLCSASGNLEFTWPSSPSWSKFAKVASSSRCLSTSACEKLKIAQGSFNQRSVEFEPIGIGLSVPSEYILLPPSHGTCRPSSRKRIQVAARILLVCWLGLVWVVLRSSRLCTRSALPRFFPGGLLQTFQMRETLQALHTPASSQAAATLRV